MIMSFIRLFIVFIGAGVGYAVAFQAGYGFKPALICTGIGMFFSLLIILIETSTKKARLNVITGGFIGLTISLIISNLLISAIGSMPIFKNSIQNMLINFFIVLMFGYIGVMLGMQRAEVLDMINSKFYKKDDRSKNTKIFDTSVIIDGRIADICETGFLEGDMVIPKFVLGELQQIADSSDSLKRNRGRRGLEILQRMQKSIDLNIKIIDDDFPKIKEVDAKLVVLSQKLNGKVITNDYNLNKVAELQGVSVLNINQLANAVKPVVLPGEVMNVHILKEGKEYGQGVAYLDDGTMVVVDNARKSIGKGVEVSVTSVLQTTAGRMIFAKLKEDALNEVHV